MLKKLLWWVVKRYKLHEVVNQLSNEEKINCALNQVINKGGVFYPETIIYNGNEDAQNITINKNTHVRGELLVFKYGGKIAIGENCFVGQGTRIWSGEEIIIGNNVLISHNVNIIDTNSHELNALERAESYKLLIKEGHTIKKGSIITSPILIEDNAWISFNATILKGVTIGRGAIVAAGSVVTKNVPPFAMVGGNPAGVIKFMKEI